MPRARPGRGDGRCRERIIDINPPISQRADEACRHTCRRSRRVGMSGTRRHRSWRRALLFVAGVALLPTVAPAMRADAAQLSAQYAQKIGPVQVLQIRRGFYMLRLGGSGINVALDTGADGAVMVDTGPARASASLIAAIRQLTPAPIRYLVDTSADANLVGGNASLSRSGHSFIANQLGRAAPIIAQQNVLSALLARPDADHSLWALPSELYSAARGQYNFYLNHQGVAVIWQPAAHSSGDSVVRFSRSDVVVTGDIFDDTRFPVIDLAHGGSVQGEIRALNRLINALVFPSVPLVGQPAMQGRQAGTLVIPVRGPVCNQTDLVIYRDMLVTVRDRVEQLIRQEKTLSEVEAANPAGGYRSRYGADSGSWTTNDFVRAVYESLKAGPTPKTDRRGAER